MGSLISPLVARSFVITTNSNRGNRGKNDGCSLLRSYKGIEKKSKIKKTSRAGLKPISYIRKARKRLCIQMSLHANDMDP